MQILIILDTRLHCFFRYVYLVGTLIPYFLFSLQSGLCKNNTRTTYLTSGYKSEQDVSKPPSNNQGIGKCSHGSQDDTSRLKSATGGIYKGRSSSVHAPHFHLHYEAFEAAKLATVYFLSDESKKLCSKCC